MRLLVNGGSAADANVLNNPRCIMSRYFFHQLSNVKSTTFAVNRLAGTDKTPPQNSGSHRRDS